MARSLAGSFTAGTDHRFIADKDANRASTPENFRHFANLPLDLTPDRFSVAAVLQPSIACGPSDF